MTRKNYELSNHLGNVYTVITDKKLGIATSTYSTTVSYYTADVITANDYFAFGAPMKGRTFNAPDYRYGFNGMEKCDEVHSHNGDFYLADFRSYDARLGRWLSTDPVVKSWESPYAGFANNPIYFVDPSGLDPAPGKGGRLSREQRQQARKDGYSRGDLRRAEKYRRSIGGVLSLEMNDEGRYNLIGGSAYDSDGKLENKVTFESNSGIGDAPVEWEFIQTGINANAEVISYSLAEVDKFFQGDANYNGRYAISIEAGPKGGAAVNPLALQAGHIGKILTIDQDMAESMMIYGTQPGGPERKLPMRPDATYQRNRKTGPSFGAQRITEEFVGDLPDPQLKVQTAEGVLLNSLTNNPTRTPVVLTGKYQWQDRSGNMFYKETYNDGSVIFKMGSPYGIQIISDPGNADWQLQK
jgi:RHS repeat-associated protein